MDDVEEARKIASEKQNELDLGRLAHLVKYSIRPHVMYSSASEAAVVLLTNIVTHHQALIEELKAEVEALKK